MSLFLSNSKLSRVGIATLLVALISACSAPNPNLRKGGGVGVTHKQPSRPVTTEQYNRLDRFITSVSQHLDEIWGVDNISYKATDLVKYSDNYRTRSIINFTKGTLTFETVSINSYQEVLRNEILYTLLMSNKPEFGKLYDQGVPNVQGTPFLVNQVVDHNRRPIQSLEQANAFADYLLSQKVQSKINTDGFRVAYVQIPLVSTHMQNRVETYRPMIYRIAGQFDVDPRLVLAITETESAFNPFARSSSNALGLMQILARQAGADAYKALGYSGRPSEQYLLNPENNVRLGVTYINIMKTRYFNGVRDPLALRYLITASYNGGPGGVLRVFDTNREYAIDRINGMTAQQVYNFLLSNHYSQETRRYLQKVSQNYRKY